MSYYRRVMRGGGWPEDASSADQLRQELVDEYHPESVLKPRAKPSATIGSTLPKKGRDRRHTLRVKLLEKQNGICPICGLVLHINDASFDHIKPKSKGGSNALVNIQVTHYVCNNRKGDSC